ncbi:MAG: pyrroline-5-carboxylate reductase [Acidobacteria bacterium SCN 69-37]|nr:MAG: pyrroline-5-carboxylate reductase [Acidobacteria bacterium SCN 69-37]
MEAGTLVPAGRKLGVIGAGVMGQALMKGLLSAGLLTRDQIWAADRSPETREVVARDLGVAVSEDYRHELAQTDVVLVCVKPSQIVPTMATARASGPASSTLFISILAGVTTAQLEAALALPNPWVRAMPNTPAVVGEGMTVVCRGRDATTDHLETARRVFAAVGRCEVVDETYCNAITALSGSGPAYMYLVMEALADGGVRVGLPRDLALTLVAQTMLGAARMVQATGRHPASLRDDVTTPAGCTIGGLLMLEDGKIRSVFARAVEEATRIVEDLGRSASTTRKTGDRA